MAIAISYHERTAEPHESTSIFIVRMNSLVEPLCARVVEPLDDRL
jgi:hypothetical protein